jgi:alpha-glucosidase (family GH31 glycosyl hydrolase)
LCVGRWGYKDIDVLEAVVANYSKAGLPLEGLWVDIEAMNNRFQVFTFDTGVECSHCWAPVAVTDLPI